MSYWGEMFFYVDEGRFLVVVFFAPLLRLRYVSFLVSLKYGRIFEPKSRLIDRFGAFEVASSSGGCLSSLASAVCFLGCLTFPPPCELQFLAH